MAPSIVTCAHVLIGGYDFSSQFTNVQVNRSSENLDVSTFGAQTRKHKGGVKDASITGEGFVNLGSSLMDGILFSAIGTDATLVTVFPDYIPNAGCSTAGGYAMSGVDIAHKFGGSYGQMLPFALDVKSQGNLVHAVVSENTLSTAWGTCEAWSTSFQTAPRFTLGATCGFTAGQRLSYGVHITSFTTAINGGGTGMIGTVWAASSSGITGTDLAVYPINQVTCKIGATITPIDVATLSTDRPWFHTGILMGTGTSSGNAATGLFWIALQ